MKKTQRFVIALFLFTSCNGDEPEKPSEDAGDTTHTELGADLESDSEDGSIDTPITDLEPDEVEIEDAQVETDLSPECGTSSVTAGVAPAPIVVDNNQLLNSTLGSADYVWFWDDYTVRSYVPKAALSITQAVVERNRYRGGSAFHNTLLNVEAAPVR